MSILSNEFPSPGGEVSLALGWLFFSCSVLCVIFKNVLLLVNISEPIDLTLEKLNFK